MSGALKRIVVVLALGAAVLAAVPGSSAGVVAEGFETSVEIVGLNRPTNLEFSPDGRVFVAEQSGLLKVFDGLDDPSPTTVSDLRDAVHSVDGRGLLGLALDPDFPDTPHVYVMYAHDAPLAGIAPTFGVPGATNDECPNPPGPGKCVISGRISRLVLEGDVAVAETVLLEDWCQEWTSHSVGDLAFGPDGALYASAGDGAFAGQPDWGQRSGENGCGDPPVAVGELQELPDAEGGAFRAQDLRTSTDPAGLNGTVIRIDKNTGDALPDNPAAGAADPNVERVIAYGLRNPYRMTLRPGTDELWLGDVGWNTWEEINVVDDVTGSVPNFGWPCLEGTDLGYDIGATICTDLLAEGPTAVTPPFYAYRQREAIVEGGDPCLNNNGSPSAVAFYEGGAYPPAFDGALFFGDYSRRCVWAMLPDESGDPDPGNIVHVFDGHPIVDLEVGPGGDIFALSIYGGGLGGTVLRLKYPSGETTPLARVEADVTSGPEPLTVSLSAADSRPGVPGDELTFDWDLDGDGTFGDASGETASTTFTEQGVYQVQVKVTDDRGGSDTAAVTITAGRPPVVAITAPDPSLTWAVDDLIEFSGTFTDADGQLLPPDSLVWDLNLHHCESLDDCHTHTLGTIEGTTTGSFLAPEHEYPSYVDISLTGTSVTGLSATTSVSLYPQTALLTLASEPSGLVTSLNGAAAPSPTTHEVIVGAGNTVSAPGPQTQGTTLFDFDSWSDGGGAAHDVAITTDTTITAVYAEREGVTVVGEGPNQPTVTVVPGDASLAVSWQPVPGADEYQFRYRVLKRTWMWDPNTTETSRLVEGLANGVEHTVKVRSVVDGTWSNWTEVIATPGEPSGGGDPGGGDPGGGDPGGGDPSAGVTVPGAGPDQPTITVVPGDGSLTTTWDPVPGGGLYQFRFKRVGRSWSWDGSTTDLSRVATGLPNGVDHVVEVRALVDGTWRDWTSVTIAPSADAGDPGGGDPGGGDPGDGSVTVDGATPSEPTVTVVSAVVSLAVSWGAVDGATKYQFRYRVLRRSWYWDPQTTDLSRLVEDLLPSTEHTVKVRAYVNGSWSDWTEVVISTLDP